MGSYITICFVNDWEGIDSFRQNCMCFFSKNNDNLRLKSEFSAQHSFPSSKEVEVESILPLLLDKCIMDQSSQFCVDYTFGDYQLHDILVNVEKIEFDSIGLVISIEERQLMGIASIDELERYILRFLNKNILGFSYCFCDNEVGLEYDIGSVLSGKKCYSILVSNFNGKILNSFSTWKIDGLSSRSTCVNRDGSD